MWLIIPFAPVLVLLPFVLVAGIIVVAVPGGFIVVLGGAYYLLLGFLGLVGSVAKTWRDGARASSSRAATRPAPGRRPPATALAPAITPATRRADGTRLAPRPRTNP